MLLMNEPWQHLALVGWNDDQSNHQHAQKVPASSIGVGLHHRLHQTVNSCMKQLPAQGFSPSTAFKPKAATTMLQMTPLLPLAVHPAD
jgi:hypothetical protein